MSLAAPPPLSHTFDDRHKSRLCEWGIVNNGFATIANCVPPVLFSNTSDLAYSQHKRCQKQTTPAQSLKRLFSCSFSNSRSSIWAAHSPSLIKRLPITGCATSSSPSWILSLFYIFPLNCLEFPLIKRLPDSPWLEFLCLSLAHLRGILSR